MRPSPRLLPAAILLLPWAGSALAQAWPAKTVRIVVPFTAGGTTDIIARLISARLSEALGQQFIVDNRAGVGGVLGMDIVAKAPPDGYTVVLGSTSSTAVNVGLYPKMPYDPLKDLAPIMQVATGPYVLAVHPALPAKDVAQLIALARARPGQLNFGSSGNGTALHLTAELLKSMTGTQMVHVPYKGASAAMPDLLSGQTQFMFSDMPLFAPHVKAGRLRVLAVTTARRSSVLPDLPPIADTVPGYEATSWYGFMAPAGTPREIIARFNAEVTKVLKLQDIRDRYRDLGIEPVSGTPEQFGAYIASEIRRWGAVIKSADVKIE
ncbi:MAG: tripartite tricarboxylate transporter substrate binding protein [bacterium]|jgi:tripartite-type tricarboxylate transporter receptor subunit TctC|nr:tripartite tricarboxylate transporter substrate binding protein [Betaproteobacteria bacterium]